LPKTERQHFLAAFILGSLALLIALSLVPTPTNLLKNIGDAVQYFLYHWLGLCAWIVPVVLGRFAWGFFRDEPVHRPPLKVLGSILVLVSVATPLSVLFPDRFLQEGESWGGRIGEWVGLFLWDAVGTFGVIVVSFLLFVLASWMLEREMHLVRFFQWIGKGLRNLGILAVGSIVKIVTRSAKSVRETYADWQTRRLAARTAADARKKLIRELRDSARLPDPSASSGRSGQDPAMASAAATTSSGPSRRPDLREVQVGDDRMEDPVPSRTRTPRAEPEREAPRNDDVPADIELEESPGEDEEEMKPVRKRLVRSWQLPPVHLLKGEKEAAQAEADDFETVSRTLMETLRNFGVEATVTGANPGPTVTQYEVQPSAGVKISEIATLAQDLALALQVAQVRVAPIAGKTVVGVEVPNRKGRIVTLKEMVDHEGFMANPHRLRVVMGREIAGNPVFCNLNEMPHLLIAGATGSGKSVCVNVIVASLLLRSTPEEVRLLLVDPKRVEMTTFQGLPHLAVPVVNDPKEAQRALKWLVSEMEERYHKLAHAGVRDIDTYNAKVLKKRAEGTADEDTLYYIVVLIDELADLMMTAKDQVEDAIARLAQMARAVGIHLVLATQRPSVEVITGTIKANFPSRVAFQVFSKVDSRTILDANGAEALLGRGDMLYLPSGTPKPVRLQGAYVTTDEVERLADFWRSQGEPDYAVDLSEKARELVSEDSEDDLYDEAVEAVVLAKQASTSLLQRRLKIGYGRAARLLDDMEKRGIVGPPDGNKPRKVLVKNLGDLPGEGGTPDGTSDEEENDENGKD